MYDKSALIEDGQILSIPLHGAGKLYGVAGADLFEPIAALRQFNKRETKIAVMTVRKQVPFVIIPVKVLCDQWRITDDSPGTTSAFKDNDVAAAARITAQNPDGKVTLQIYRTA